MHYSASRTDRPEPARLVPEPVAVISPLLDSPNLKREATPVRTIATVVRPASDLTRPMATESSWGSSTSDDSFAANPIVRSRRSQPWFADALIGRCLDRGIRRRQTVRLSMGFCEADSRSFSGCARRGVGAEWLT